MDEKEEKLWVLAEDLKFKIYMDGDALCIVPVDFKNLQESPAFFIKLNRIKQEDFRKFVQKILEDKKKVAIE